MDLGNRTVMDSVSSIRDAIPAMAHVSFERLIDFVYTQPRVVLVAETAGKRVGFLLLLDGMPDEVTLAPQAFVAFMAVEPGARRGGSPPPFWPRRSGSRASGSCRTSP